MIVRAQSQLAAKVCEKLDGSRKTASPLARLLILSSSTRSLQATTSFVWPGFRQHILHTMASMIWLLKKMYGKGKKNQLSVSWCFQAVGWATNYNRVIIFLTHPHAWPLVMSLVAWEWLYQERTSSLGSLMYSGLFRTNESRHLADILEDRW